MGWLNVLAATYDNCISEVGKTETIHKGQGKKAFDQTVILLPISHITNNAGIEITINENGEFRDAAIVDKNDRITVMPVSEDSASRSSGITPMPLFDKLSYIAGDYDDHVSEDKKKRPCYEEYMKSLHRWADLPDTPPKVKAICKYLDRGTVLKDLKDKNVYDGTDVFVRFIVTGIDMEARTWCDKKIYDSFIGYYDSLLAEIDIDYTTGELCPVTQKLPAKIRHSGDKAKLISSNDNTNFTFRGRFSTAAEAVRIGYEVSQKAHNALRWLISRQGYKNGSEYIVCWSPGNLNVPSPMSDPGQFDIEEDEEISFDTEELFANRLNKAIAGYRQNFDRDIKRIQNNTLKVVVMAVDTADGSGQGRLSITYYNEQEPESFFDSIFTWYRECCWEFYAMNKNGYLISSPSPEDMVSSAFGVERGEFVDIEEKAKKKYIDRLLPCIVQGRKIPKDIVYAAVRNVGNPQRFKQANWRRLLISACAMIKKYQYDYGKEVFSVALNKDSMDRDYLFGRLLAVSHKLEDYVNYKSGNNGRETNAMKYWSSFAQKPARTFMTIRDKLQPYISKLNTGTRNFYQSLAEEIFAKLEETGSFNNEPLKENYLLGYYSQMAEFRKYNHTESNEEEDQL